MNLVQFYNLKPLLCCGCVSKYWLVSWVQYLVVKSLFINGLYMRTLLLISLTFLQVLSNPVFADKVFSPEQIIQWKSKSFAGNTRYSIEFDKQLNQSVIRAESNKTASGLFYEERIDLNKTPYLSWSWKAEKFPTLNDEKVKSGDDYTARIYVVIKDGWTPLGTKAINYVWSQQSPIDTVWPNPFAGKRAMMLAVQQGSFESGWVMEKRHLKADLKKLFGKEFRYIDGIAIMTDTDNSGSSAVSYYSGLKLTEQ